MWGSFFQFHLLWYRITLSKANAGIGQLCLKPMHSIVNALNCLKNLYARYILTIGINMSGRCRYGRLSNFQLCLAAITITGEGCKSRPLLSTLSLMAFSSEDSFKCHLRYGPSVYMSSSEGLAPSSHSGIQTRDAKIMFWHRRSNHCAIRMTVGYASKFS
jgi:hypothetical protein